MQKVKYTLSVLGWFFVFLFVTICFMKAFNPILHPAGMTGQATRENIIASNVILIFFIILFILSGYKGYKSIITAAMIFFLLPIVIMIIRLGIIVTFSIATIFQGLSFGILGFEGVGFAFLFIMPFIIMFSYMIGKSIFERRKKRDII